MLRLKSLLAQALSLFTLPLYWRLLPVLFAFALSLFLLAPPLLAFALSVLALAPYLLERTPVLFARPLFLFLLAPSLLALALSLFSFAPGLLELAPPAMRYLPGGSLEEIEITRVGAQ